MEHLSAMLLCSVSETEGICEQVVLLRAHQEALHRCNTVVLRPWMLHSGTEHIDVRIIDELPSDASRTQSEVPCTLCGRRGSRVKLTCVHGQSLAIRTTVRDTTREEVHVNLENHSAVACQTYKLSAKANQFAGGIVMRFSGDPLDDLVNRFQDVCGLDEPAIPHNLQRIGKPRVTFALRPMRRFARMEFEDDYPERSDPISEEMKCRRQRERSPPPRQPIYRPRRF